MNDEPVVDVRIRVSRSVYRQLFAEARRRRLDGAGELVELMLHREPIPRRSPRKPPEDARPIPPEEVPAMVERIRAGELSVRRAALEAGVTRGAVYYWLRKDAERRAEHARHAAALDALGVHGRPPVPVPTVPKADT